MFRLFFQIEISKMTCRLPKDRVLFLFTWICILLFSTVSAGETGSLQCPSLVQVELGTNGVIACNISFEFKNLYWYKGVSFSDYPPIIRFQDGVPEKGDEFEITPDGALVILNTDIKQEGIYTVVVFRLNTKHEYASVSLQTYAHPKPSFPVIQLCNGTQSCQLGVDTGGSVQCVLQGARPAFGIDLKSSGLQLANITHSNVTDAKTGLTNTSVKANYQSSECVQVSNITCTATGFEMQEMMSTVTFHNDCNPITPADGERKGSGGVVVAITLVLVFIVVIVAVTLYFKRFSVNCWVNNQERNDIVYGPVEQSEGTVIDTNSQKTPTKKNKGRDNQKDDKTKLLEALSEKYRADYFGSLSEDRIISIDDVYINLEFEVKDDNGETKTVDIYKLLKQPYINDKKNRIFVSNKMQLTFSSFFAYLWSEHAMKDNILLHFNIQNVSKDTSVVTVIKQMLQDNLPITEDAIIKVIEKFGCHIILDEVDFRHFVPQTENDTSFEPIISGNKGSPSNWTIGNILRDLKRKIIPKNIFQWIILYDFDNVAGSHYTSYELVNIKEITGYIFAHFDKYIDSVVVHYCRNGEEKEYKKMVKEVMLQYDLQRKFERARLLFMQMTHLITKMCLTSNDNISNRTGISPLIIESLSLLKSRYLKKLPLNDSDALISLEEKLGKIAFNEIDGKGKVEQSLSEDLIKFCKSIGVIMQSSSAERIKFTSAHVKWFVTASFLKDKLTLSSFLDQAVQPEADSKSEEKLNVLPFVCALQSSYSHQICEKLLKNGKMNHFLDCFYESTNEDEFHGVIKKYLEKDSHPIIINFNKEQLSKLRCLMKYCQTWEVIVSGIEFRRVSHAELDIGSVHLVEFKMPAVEKITFHKFTLDEDDTFLHYLEWTLGLSVKTVCFDECILPELSKNIKDNLQRLFRQFESQVLITKTETGEKTEIQYVLNKKEIDWDKSAEKPSRKKNQTGVVPFVQNNIERSLSREKISDYKEQINADRDAKIVPERPPSRKEKSKKKEQRGADLDAKDNTERPSSIKKSKKNKRKKGDPDAQNSTRRPSSTEKPSKKNEHMTADQNIKNRNTEKPSTKKEEISPDTDEKINEVNVTDVKETQPENKLPAPQKPPRRSHTDSNFVGEPSETEETPQIGPQKMADNDGAREAGKNGGEHTTQSNEKTKEEQNDKKRNEDCSPKETLDPEKDQASDRSKDSAPK